MPTRHKLGVAVHLPADGGARVGLRRWGRGRRKRRVGRYNPGMTSSDAPDLQNLRRPRLPQVDHLRIAAAHEAARTVSTRRM